MLCVAAQRVRGRRAGGKLPSRFLTAWCDQRDARLLQAPRSHVAVPGDSSAQKCPDWPQVAPFT